MKNINQQLLSMICFSFLLSILFSCTNQNANKIVTSSEKEKTIPQEQTVTFPIELKLDTNSRFQNKQIEPEDFSFFGNEKYLIHLSQGDDIGYVLFKMENKFYVALIEWVNSYTVIGITEISGLSQTEEYIELLYSKTPKASITFGIINQIDNEIKTIKAWRINNSKRIIEELMPSTIDFSETYNTEI